MNNCEDEKFSTPVQTKTKRLGLRRNNSSAKCDSSSNLRKAATTTILNAASAGKATSDTATTTPLQHIQSDVKVNYRYLQTSNKNNSAKHEVPESPGTPTSTGNLLQRQAVSTNCRPYRLSLSKRVRERMTKKRLEFHLANEIGKEEDERKICKQQEMGGEMIVISQRSHISVLNQVNSNDIEKKDDTKMSKQHEMERILDITSPSLCSTIASPVVACEMRSELPSILNPKEMSHDELLHQIEKCRKVLKDRQKHARKVQELQEAIRIWQTGFSSALNHLQDKLVPRVDKETLLEQLRISKDMMKYVND